MAATTMRAMATQPLRNQLNWYAVTNESSHGRIPYDGWNTNSQMMPAMAGAMPYGHSSSERYTPSPRILALASEASSSASASPTKVTTNEKTKLVTTERRYPSSRNSRSKFVSPT